MTNHSTLPPCPGAFITGEGRTATIRFSYIGALVTDLKEIPAGNRSYDADTKCWTIYSHDGKWTQWAIDRLRAYFPFAEIVREITQHQGDDGPIGDYAELHLLPSAPPAVIRAAYRALSQELHPDKGGSHVRMIALNASYERLREAGVA